MRWTKQGLIYAPGGHQWWARSYAFNPTPETIDDKTIRVYFASLDENRHGRIGYVDLDAADPTRIKYETPEPVLDVGEAGAFDDSGVNPSCVINVGNEKHLYYIGWQRCERVPYMLFSGLAILDQHDSFRKYSRTPILDRTEAEPFSRSALCVLSEGPRLNGWYWSCERWTVEQKEIHYNNVIKHAESTDGLHWNTESGHCIAPEGPDDYAVGRPWIVKDGSIYKMWYAIRSRAPVSYRIGYAESRDRRSWQRMDDLAGIERSADGWDSEMVCFPAVVDAGGKRYMFYNGNQHGRTGFGCAVLDSD